MERIFESVRCNECGFAWVVNSPVDTTKEKCPRCRIRELKEENANLSSHVHEMNLELLRQERFMKENYMTEHQSHKSYGSISSCTIYDVYTRCKAGMKEG